MRDAWVTVRALAVLLLILAAPWALLVLVLTVLWVIGGWLVGAW